MSFVGFFGSSVVLVLRVVVTVLLCGSCSSIVVVLVRVSRSRTVSRIYFGIGCAGFRFF